jgi:hypothetical protein
VFKQVFAKALGRREELERGRYEREYEQMIDFFQVWRDKTKEVNEHRQGLIQTLTALNHYKRSLSYKIFMNLKRNSQYKKAV